MKILTKIVGLLVISLFGIVTINAQSTSRKKPEDWKKINLPKFSFSIPKDMKAIKTQGIDSQVWRYENKDLFLTVDLGEYSVLNPGVKEFPDFQEEFIKIAGENARLVFYRPKEPVYDKYNYASEAYLLSSNERSNLAFRVASESKDSWVIAKKIFLSLNFRNQ